MEDRLIIELYWSRSEKAITETSAKYGNYCGKIAFNILNNLEDSEECVNDTWLGAWNSMPPRRPAILASFLGKITRRLAIDKWRARGADKRGGGEITLVLEELANSVASTEDTEQEIERRELEKVLHTFLSKLPVTERRVFLCRYWYMDSVPAIAEQFGFTQSKVASMLYRIRGGLRKYLEKEGYR